MLSGNQFATLHPASIGNTNLATIFLVIFVDSPLINVVDLLQIFIDVSIETQQNHENQDF
jgi:hypothetical protein